MRFFAWVLLGAVVAAPGTAHALAQSKHRSLSYDACRNLALPMDFCDEVGAASYNVDRHEWDVLAAHAQPEAGQSACDAASAVSTRVATLGAELSGLLLAPGATQTRASVEQIATALGRTLHTLQDNCAHSGMPNDQHAWFSLSDACLDTESSPDVQPGAVQCAEQQTALAFDAFATAFGDAGLTTDSFKMYKEDGETIAQYFPPRGGVCDFLKSAATWDGIDRRWDNGVMVPVLRDQYFTSLVIDPAAPALDACAAGDVALPPAAPVDVTQKIEWCTSIQLYCVGKGDGTDAAPPWETGAPTTSANAGEASGCALGSQRAGTGRSVLLLGVVLGLALARRRRRVSTPS